MIAVTSTACFFCHSDYSAFELLLFELLLFELFAEEVSESL